MRFGIVYIVILVTVHMQSQEIQQSRSLLKVDDNPRLQTNSYKLSPGLTKPTNDFSLYSNSKDSLRGDKNEKSFDMTGSNGLLKPNHQDKAIPKWFTKDKEIKKEYQEDQYFGDFKSDGEFITLMYRDHEYVDGDIVRVLVNDFIVQSRITLSGSFQGFKINLTRGLNKIDIQALNQGLSGPNTAQFKLYDELGKLITQNEWNLTTGVKASMIVVKK